MRASERERGGLFNVPLISSTQFTAGVAAGFPAQPYVLCAAPIILPRSRGFPQAAAGANRGQLQLHCSLPQPWAASTAVTALSVSLSVGLSLWLFAY